MDEPGTPALAVAIPFGVVLIAFVTASLNAVLDARDRGVPVLTGLSSPAREVARLLRQQRRRVVGADVLLWRIGGIGLIMAAFLAVLVVPFGSSTAADISVGVVWFNAVDVLLWALWWLLGWGSNSAVSLIGGYRFLAQAVAYELPLMLAVIAPAIAARSLRLSDVVAAQDRLWYVVSMPVAFVVFCLSVGAFSAWGPFAHASGPDIAAGVLAELSGPDRLVVLAGRWCLLVAGSAFAVPMFLGGGAGPGLPPTVWVLIKLMVLLGVLTLVGRLFPAVRPQRFAEVAWVIILPLVLLQLLFTAVLSAMGRG